METSDNTTPATASADTAAQTTTTDSEICEATTTNSTNSEICDMKSEIPSPDTEEKHNADWYAKSAYECFIKNADPDTSDANPVAAIQRIFDQRASEDLKAQVKTEGKTAEGAYQFLWAVARLCKQTDGGCHISPETGYAIAMHYFQDVPASVLDEFEPALKASKRKREAEKRSADIKAAAEKAKLAAKDKAKKDAKKKTKSTTGAPSATATTTQNASAPAKDGGTSVASESSVSSTQTTENASTTPKDAPSAQTTNEPTAVQEAPSKPSKPTPPPSAQMSLLDSLFA